MPDDDLMAHRRGPFDFILLEAAFESLVHPSRAIESGRSPETAQTMRARWGNAVGDVADRLIAVRVEINGLTNRLHADPLPVWRTPEP